MTRKALLALLFIGLSQNGYSFSLKDALKETVKAVADAAAESAKGQGHASGEAGAQSQTVPATGVASSTPTSTGKVPEASPEDLMKQGMWKDLKTGLVWSRCNIGQVFDQGWCGGVARKFESIDAALVAAFGHRLGGHDDWRIPTVDEINSLRNCGDRGGFATDSYIEYPGDNGSIKRAYDRCEGGSGYVEIGTQEIFRDRGNDLWTANSDAEGKWYLYNGSKIKHESNPNGSMRALAVRGGKPSSLYVRKLAKIKGSGDTLIKERAAYQVSPDDVLMKQGMWKDPRTGLVWSRCKLNEAWTGATCAAKKGPSSSSLEEAVIAAYKLRLGGFEDWRAPTIDEINGLSHCIDRGGFDTKDFREYRGDDGTPKRAYLSCKEVQGDGYLPVIGTPEIFPTIRHAKGVWLTGFDSEAEQVLRDKSVYAVFSGSGMAVRGGKPAPFYAQKLAQAQVVDAKAQAAQAAKAQAKQQEEAEYARRTNELQKNLKPGDRVAHGLVLEVKGDLVKLQTHELRCVSRHYSGGCERADVLVTGEKWVRRDEIRPIVTAR